MKVVYSPRYELDLGAHVFPTNKYRLVHARLLESGMLTAADILEPQPASWDELALVHTREYLAKLRDGALTPDEHAQLQLPWSRAIIDGFRTMVGGTILASMTACRALQGLERAEPEPVATPPPPGEPPTFQVVMHLGGGLHHAFANHGEGFCPFNDVAVAVRSLQEEGVERIAIIDLDVHHGNGTAFIFESDPRVFTFSMHQERNYPAWKPRSSLDIGLADGTDDDTFLERLATALPLVLASRPQSVFYLAGGDPYEDDQLGGLRLTRNGLRERDRLVIDGVRRADVPLVVTLAGGYARRIEDTVAIHVATVEEAMLAAARSR